MKWTTKLFLILLQLAIGWHFLYEGLWKIKEEKKWSSRPYLSAANGPTGPAMRWSAGDPAVTRDGVNFTVANPTIAVTSYFELKPLDPAVAPVNQRLHKHMPAQLEKEWDAYFADFLKSYGLDKGPAPDQAEVEKLPPEFIAVFGANPTAGSLAGIPWGAVEISWIAKAGNFENEPNPDPRAQRLLAERRFNQMKAVTVAWLLEGKKKVKRPNIGGPAGESNISVQERVKEYVAANQKAKDLDATTATMFGHKATPELKKARDEAAAIRTELLGDIKDQTTQMKLALRDVLTIDQQRIAFLERYQLTDKSFRELRRTQIVADAGKQEPFPAVVLAKIEPLRDQTFDTKKEFIAAAEKQLDEGEREKYMGALVDQAKVTPDAPAEWSRLHLVDASVRYGLVVIGGLLILGLFSRLACVAGALFLLSFYLAMPAFPWLPEPAMSEGHYLFVNKNIIEMLALLAIASSKPGRRYGLDLWVRMIIGAFRGKKPVNTKREEYRTIAVKVPADGPVERQNTTEPSTRSDPSHAS
jgi:uncharacterized membrane protein YphA (DoxX/SURF4 family)